MHRGFLDKGRRKINLREMQVESILPEHFGELYPKFVSLLTRYYEWQDQNNPNELLYHLFAARDINETDVSLLSFIEDEFLLGESYFEGFGDQDFEKRAAANFSNHLFRSKGTKFAIEWFFRSFYGLDAEVVYPKENVFTLNDRSSQIGPDSLRYLTNDKLYQTFAILVRVGVPLSKWRDIFKLFAHPAGMYLGAEVLLLDDAETEIITLNDLIDQYTTPSYALTVFTSPEIPNERAEFTFVATGTNVRNDGIDALYWYGEHITTNDSDFAIPLYDSNNKQYLPINNGVGSFTITPIVDGEVESDEQFKVYIEDKSGRALDDITVTVIDAAPVLSVSVGDVIEGANIEAVITADSTDIGKTITWNISGSDDRIPVKSGSLEISSTTETITISTVADEDYQGAQTYTFTITDSTISYNTSDTFALSDAAPVYQLTGDPGIGVQGNSVTYTVSGTNIPDGSVWFYIENSSPNPTDDADWTSTPPRNESRQEIVISGGTGSLTLTYASNGDTATEYYEAYIYNSSTGGTELASSFRLILGSISTATTVVPDKTSVVENGTQAQRTITFTVTAGSEEADGDYTFTIQGLSGSVDLNDFENSSGGAIVSITNVPFEITSGAASIEIIVNDDNVRDGVETFRLIVKNDSGVTVSTSSTITIDASSVPEYSFAAYDEQEDDSITVITELTDLYIGVDPITVSQTEELLYIELSGTGASQYSVNQRTVAVRDQFVTSKFETLGDNSTVESNRTVTATITLGDYASGSPTLTLGTVNVTLTDPEVSATPVYNLTADTTTPSEGDTINFTVGGTNIPNGTYYRRITSIRSTVTSAPTPQGTSLIRLSDTSGISIGMISNAIGVNGTVTYVDGTTITMSSGVSDTISTGMNLQFADPSVFADFSSGSSGTVAVTSNSGTFSLTTAVNDDTSDDAYTMGLYTSVASNVPVASVGFTIADSNPNSTVDVQFNSGQTSLISDIRIGSTSTSTLSILPDGGIYATGNIEPEGIGVQIGTWTSGTPSGNFTVEATITTGPSGLGTAYGSFGTALSLSTSRSWYLELPAPSLGNRVSEMIVNITITDNEDPSNTSTQVFDFKCETNAPLENYDENPREVPPDQIER